jgi:large subunit ribosomal protein L9
VTATDIADRLWEENKVRVDRRKIQLPESIKRIGRYSIPVELFTDVTVEVRTLVVPEGGELPPEEELAAMEAAEEAAAAEAQGSTAESVEYEYVDEPDEAEAAAEPGAEPDNAPAAAAAESVPAESVPEQE